jgi:hypothetical protein
MYRSCSRLLVAIASFCALGATIVSPAAVAASQTQPHHNAPPAHLTYTAANAVRYAETWWSGYNPNYPKYDADCTNFVSQALLAGGFPQMYSGGSSTHYDTWWVSGTSSNSNSWSVAPILMNFLWVHNPGGIYTAFWTPGVGSGKASGTKPGGLIFYDWGWLGGNEGVSHASIVVATGTDPGSGWTGDLVDSHTSPRYHAYWTLEPYNPDNSGSTAYTVVGIAQGN